MNPYIIDTVEKMKSFPINHESYVLSEALSKEIKVTDEKIYWEGQPDSNFPEITWIKHLPAQYRENPELYSLLGRIANVLKNGKKFVVQVSQDAASINFALDFMSCVYQHITTEDKRPWIQVLKDNNYFFPHHYHPKAHNPLPVGKMTIDNRTKLLWTDYIEMTLDPFEGIVNKIHDRNDIAFRTSFFNILEKYRHITDKENLSDKIIKEWNDEFHKAYVPEKYQTNEEMINEQIALGGNPNMISNIRLPEYFQKMRNNQDLLARFAFPSNDMKESDNAFQGSNCRFTVLSQNELKWPTVFSIPYGNGSVIIAPPDFSYKDSSIDSTETKDGLSSQSVPPMKVEITGVNGKEKASLLEYIFSLKIDGKDNTAPVHTMVKFLSLLMASIEGSGIAAKGKQKNKKVNTPSVVWLDKGHKGTIKSYCDILDLGGNEPSRYFRDALLQVTRVLIKTADNGKDNKKRITTTPSELKNYYEEPVSKSEAIIFKNVQYGTIRRLKNIELSISKEIIARLKGYKYPLNGFCIKDLDGAFWDIVERMFAE